MQEDNRKILIWGLHGVGKTTFIHALPRELSLFPETDLRFEVQGELPILAPTDYGSEFEYHFKVVSSAGKIIKDYSLGLYDDKGDAMKDALLDIDKESIILSYLRSSKGIIAILDPIVILNDAAQRKDLSVYIKNLLKILSQRNDQPCLAICMNKMDKLNVRWNNPEVVFEMCFGSNWQQLKSIISNTHGVLVKYFLVSATGFVRDISHREFSNFSGDGIAVDEKWHPWNVSAPFFWIFRNLDQPSPSPWYSFWSKSEEQPYPSPFF